MSKAMADLVSDESFFLVYRQPYPCFVLMWPREKPFLMFFLIRALIACVRPYPIT